MQYDRNLVLYDESEGNDVWNLRRPCADRYKFKLTLWDNGVLALWDDGKTVWSTDTSHESECIHAQATLQWHVPFFDTLLRDAL